MPYPKANEHTFTLADFHPDVADLWVKMREPDDLPASSLQTFYRAQVILGRARRGDVLDKDEEFALTATEGVARVAIIDWNLPYPDDHDKKGVIPLHSTEELEPFGALPTGVYSFVMGRVMERLQNGQKRS